MKIYNLGLVLDQVKTVEHEFDIATIKILSELKKELAKKMSE